MRREIDLTSGTRYPPLDAMTSGELFELAVSLAVNLPDADIRAPVGEKADEAVVLTGKLLSKRGCRVY